MTDQHVLIATVIGLYVMVAVSIYTDQQSQRARARRTLSSPRASIEERSAAALQLKSASRGALGSFVWPLMVVYLIVVAVVSVVRSLFRDAF